VGAEPTWPNRVPYSIPCDDGFRWGGWHVRNSLAAWGGAAPVLFRREAVWVMRFVVVFSPYLYHCCSCFPLFAVLLNCPYPDPPVSASLFILVLTPAGGGVAVWRFCCRRQPKPKQFDNSSKAIDCSLVHTFGGEFLVCLVP